MKNRSSLCTSLSLLGLPMLVVLAGGVHAEDRLPNVMLPVDDSMAEIVAPQSHTSNIIFLNRCAGGCTIYPGYDNSRTNTSSVVASVHGSTAYITEFAHSEEEWDKLVSCVKGVYEPFAIRVTDVDPGSQPHFEAIVAGIDEQISYSAAGVAPSSCGIVNNAITFSFANQGRLDGLCWTVAQETAHAFGLDHVMDCNDPMTYLTSCGYDKTFQNVDANCGEDDNRRCHCGGTTQNSYRHIRDHFGEGTLTPPDVVIKRPVDDAVVKPNFPFEVAATDDTEVISVEFLINGVVVSEMTSPPWVINAPDGLTGRVRIDARAMDNVGTKSELIGLDVTVDANIIDSTPAEFGESCQDNAECETNLCALDAQGQGHCSQLCEIGEQSSCPANSRCVEAGDQSVCWPGTGTSNELCSAGGSSSLLSGLLFFLMVSFGRRRYNLPT